MSKIYDPATIEPKWQAIWEKEGAFEASRDHSRPKYYCLIEFPYPSGQGLHVGHPRSNTAMDIIARKRRMEGHNVLYPIGWDAFGLPTENYAIANKVAPAKVTEENINNFRNQLKRLGFSFDYTREVDTTDPNYYKWTQWIFLQLYKHGLAYKHEMPINWCPSCKIGLANEEVVGGNCERCETPVIHRVKEQWMLRITKYAQRLLDGLDTVDFIEQVKLQQRNWIGRSEGAEIRFHLADTDDSLLVYTTRPDTIFGATYMVVAPEHPLVEKYAARISNLPEIHDYIHQAKQKSDFERSEMAKEKTGIEIQGVKAINPATGKEIPLWISDYVLMSYGSGAIMAVPAHDTRDHEFAREFNLPIVEVIQGGENVQEEAYTDTEVGELINSGFLNGLSVQDAIVKITKWLEENKLGHHKVNYKLRDWVFSRQRYWGEPIPLIHCPRCGVVPLEVEDLPLMLPEVEHYEPTDSGESPLAAIDSWVNVPCPKCGEPAQRETDTMPQWAGSSWYFMRYCDPHNDQALGDKKELDYWLPVDWYNGGMEHTTLHLLYSRFWHLFLHDIGVTSASEPYQKRTSHGMILGENGEKMSKSRGNVVNPDDIVDEIGADAFRLYEMFMGAFDQAIPWSTSGARGCRRFLDRVWRLQDMLDKENTAIRPEMLHLVHSTIKKVSDDYEAMKYNTAIAAMMSMVNELTESAKVTADEFKALLLILSPVAPHICEEIWQIQGYGEPLYLQPWPNYDEKHLVKAESEIAIQINGRIRARMLVPTDMTQEEATQVLPGTDEVKNLIEGKEIIKLIFVPGRLLNIVVR
ncbi:MAG: leucine--tRNA ligase [Christensenellales bacterium]|jgi:leucyl-tRNA synthetase